MISSLKKQSSFKNQEARMISKEHKKHADLARPQLGNFGRNEWAIVGAPCSTIKMLAGLIIKELSSSFKCAYVDADHAGENEEQTFPGRLSQGAFFEYTDKINHHEFRLNDPFTTFQFRQLLNAADLILVNGNHHQAKAQVVVIDSMKESSLKKRISQLTNIQLFILSEGVDDVFDFLKDAIPEWKKIPVVGLNQEEKIISYFNEKMASAQPKLNGLVLAGGKSVRFGSDKGKIDWHGKEQRYHLADLLKSYCDEVFISCREEQVPEITTNFKTLPDTFTNLGPYGAILSAFRQQPGVAWLVTACDLPLLGRTTMQFLIDHRNISSIATAFESPFDQLPEPLITIWEPKSYPVLLSFLSQGYSCPRKVLINSNATILKAPISEALMNVNTKEEFDKVKQLIEA